MPYLFHGLVFFLLLFFPPENWLCKFLRDYRKTRWQVKDIKQKVNKRERYGGKKEGRKRRGIKGGTSGGRSKGRERT